MPRARIVAASFELHCPRCNDGVVEPSTGSFVWTEEDLRREEGTEQRCSAGCGSVTVPPVPTRVAVG